MNEKQAAERQTRIGRVYQAALERAPGDRSAFVAVATARSTSHPTDAF